MITKARLVPIPEAKNAFTPQIYIKKQKSKVLYTEGSQSDDEDFLRDRQLSAERYPSQKSSNLDNAVIQSSSTKLSTLEHRVLNEDRKFGWQDHHIPKFTYPALRKSAQAHEEAGRGSRSYKKSYNNDQILSRSDVNPLDQ